MYSCRINIFFNVWYCILGSVFIINIAYKSLPVKIYTRGLIVGGRLYGWSKINDATFLKSYSSGYEIRIQTSIFKTRTISLDKAEVDIIKEYVS